MKSKAVKRKWNTYCDHEGKFWYETDAGGHDEISLNSLVKEFKVQCELQRDEATGADQEDDYLPEWYKRRQRCPRPLR